MMRTVDEVARDVARAVAIGPHRLDPLSHQMKGPAGVVQLSPLASRFLQSLARTPGVVVERQDLIQELWRGNHHVGEPALNRVASETRRAVGDDPRRPRLIQTVHGRGYRLVAPSPGITPPRRIWPWIWVAALATFVLVAALVVTILIYATKAAVFL